MLEKTNYINMLFDFYQGLLKETQREFFELYYHDDLSLGEIAEMKQISRQAVYDQIKRIEKVLGQYESELGLVKKHMRRTELLLQLKGAVDAGQSGEALHGFIDKLLEID